MKQIDIIDTVRSILTSKDVLPEEILARHFAKSPEFEGKYNERQLLLCKKDICYNLNFLAQAVEMQSPALFDIYIRWLKTFLYHKRVSATDTAKTCVERRKNAPAKR